MGRKTERRVGTLLLLGGLCALAVPVVVSRRGTIGAWALALALAVVFVPAGVLALSAGRKLRVYPPRREITMGKLYENAAWLAFWERLGLV
jgi:hypothetical protein